MAKLYIAGTTVAAVQQAFLDDPQRSKKPGDKGQYFLSFMAIQAESISYANDREDGYRHVVSITNPNNSTYILWHVDDVKKALGRGGLRDVVYTLDPATLVPEGYEVGTQSAYRARHALAQTPPLTTRAEREQTLSTAIARFITDCEEAQETDTEEALSLLRMTYSLLTKGTLDADILVPGEE